MIECSLCGKQYVGGTGQPLHARMNNHRADIVHKKIKEKPVVAHFNQRNHNVKHMRVMIIDVLRRVDPLLRKLRESRWTITLETHSPRGMNLKTDHALFYIYCIHHLVLTSVDSPLMNSPSTCAC